MQQLTAVCLSGSPLHAATDKKKGKYKKKNSLAKVLGSNWS
jgi:hypothetical protein